MTRVPYNEWQLPRQRGGGGGAGFQANRTLYVPSMHMTSQFEPSSNALDLFQWPYGLAFSTTPWQVAESPDHWYCLALTL